jgi:hypothetical protein
MKLTKLALICAISILPITSLHAEEGHVAPIRDYIDLDVQSWLGDETIITAIKAQNEKVADMSEEDIIALDNEWREQTSADAKPFIDEVLNRPLSKFLAAKQDESAGLISELFVMDAKGMNVGQSSLTSDYWQGDEAKWQKTYLEGADAIFIDSAEVDDSTGALQSQASIAISDPATGEVIGAITIGFNLDAL